ncbi:response regulator [Aquicoccus sp. SCR17]|nr:response regulator [Carideicomes alvinocaridis]
MELKRILHVDDDDDIRTIVQLALEVVGNFDLRQYGDGPSAIAAATDFDPQLLLLDVMMPGMTGMDVRRTLVEDHDMGDVTTVYVTAKAEDSFARELMDQGAVSVITKPFDPMTLADQIRDIWARQKEAA